MTYQVIDAAGEPLDAHVEIDGTDIIVHSRGGARGGAAMRNADYGPGLRLLLERLREADLLIGGGWVDSGAVQHLPLDQRSIIEAADAARSPTDQFRILSARMKDIARTSSRPGGNSTKRIRLRLMEPVGLDLAEVLRLRPVRADFRSEERLSAQLLSHVNAEYVWRAVERLLAGESHVFGPSSDFDLIADDGTRLPPKAVFGLAASEALKREVLPRHFTGGIGTPCFNALERAGYKIVAKSASLPDAVVPVTPEDREWTEGRPRLVRHLKKERGAGLSCAKKERFLREHGRLFCERCGFRPDQSYEEAGDACIEVHHRETHVEQMAEGHRTVLEDLECLCANCHRVVHALLGGRARRDHQRIGS